MRVKVGLLGIFVLCVGASWAAEQPTPEQLYDACIKKGRPVEKCQQDLVQDRRKVEIDRERQRLFEADREQAKRIQNWGKKP